ncbi:MAG: peptide chain release factor N(5)-glutamine methyltransferase [Planctomycetaceae bacterium]|nr:peptide chain release factor N(5)-glutamine methyltransferase [Planctomycetaceae bacterium]
MTDPAATNDVWTVQRILQWTTGYLTERGVESARLEAELLLAHARECQRINLYTDLNVPLTDEERSRMRGYVKRRSQREPLAYITGNREFYGRDFCVGPGVLIPRPETETLIDVCLDLIPEQAAADICEVGFGSGCICTTLARQRSQLRVYATDVSPEAMTFARRNTQEHDVEDRVTLLAGEGFMPLADAGVQQLQGIVSNPPYVREDEMSGLEPEVAEHEPSLALVSGADGLDLIRRLIPESVSLLQPGGWMAMELDPAQAATVAALFGESGFENVRIHADLNGQDRIVSACRPGD